MVNKPTVGVIVLTYNGKQNLKPCFSSLINQTYPRIRVYHFDQASTDGSHQFVRKHFPSVTATRLNENVGFAQGNNIGMKRAFADGADVCLLINDDTVAKPTMVEELIRTYLSMSELKENIGLVQPVILLHDQPQKINSIGNAIHYLGFGYCNNLGETYHHIEHDMPIASASGAAMLVSKKYHADIGGLDEDFFMYNEDQNYSWRGLLKGYDHVLSSRAILYHKYNFRRNPSKIYHSEKNRLMMLLENYSRTTLAFLFPLLISNEIAAIAYSLFSGYFVRKISSYWYVFAHVRHIARKRKTIQNTRTISDRKILTLFKPTMEFDEMRHPLVISVLNPIYNLYYRILLRIV